MQMNRFIPALCLLFSVLASTPSNAQSYRDEFTWDDQDWFSKVDSKGTEDVQILFRDKASEFLFNSEGNLEEYYFFRSVVYLRTDKAVDDYNKLYINITSAQELKDYNARVMTKNKATRQLGKDAIKEGTTEDGDSYNYFAIEGAQAGSIVDYYYLMQKNPSYEGTHSVIQVSDPISHYRFRIISPPSLVFKITPLKGKMNVYNDTTDTVNRVVVAEVKDLPGIKDESFSNEARHELSLLYKLQDNLAARAYNLFTYGGVSQNVYENLNSSLTKSADKSLSKFLKKGDIDEDGSHAEVVRQVENYIKSNVAVLDVSNENLSDITYILSNHIASHYGMVKLLYHAVRKYEIPVEIVLTCNRYELGFSDSIENYCFLDKYLLYFPTIGDYTMPEAQLYRLGLIPYGYLDNHGLFIKEVKVGDLRTGAGKVKRIEEYPRDHSAHDMWVKAGIEEDLTTVRVHMEEKMTGFNALNYQPYYDYVNEENLKDLKEASVKNVAPEAEIVEVSIENEGVNKLMVEPFIVKSEYTDNGLLQVAGSKLLFKLGLLIGPQAEMYQEEARTMDVENTYLHSYHREIEFTIPEGYKCSNLKDLVIEVDPFEEHHTLFKSSYEVDGNVIKVVVDEYYDELVLPKSSYEDFRAVINAAANFNKITLVLEKV